MIELLHGDCLDRLKELPDCSVDACVTDPPYGLSFMGKKWDYDVPGAEVWREVLRVLKPGGHLLAFAGTRTQHRMAVNIEDAGFEIRDMIAWVYGQGFPKSLDVSKAIDKAAGVEFDSVPASGVGFMNAEGKGGYNVTKNQLLRSGDSTPKAQQWAGWGTALKPSHETITWARKPLLQGGEQAKILSSLWELEARLWLLSSASVADQSSTSSRSEYDAACATAQWTADDATSTRDALRGRMDTWQYEMAIHTSLSIASSWRRTLQESSTAGSTFTTATESKTTTDWKTLSCCLSQITPESIIQACSFPGGFSANASTAAQIFNASLALLQSTLTLSAIEPATWRALDASQAEAVSPSLEPVVMARKPLTGTVAANVLEHGTGALNIDGCRVEHVTVGSGNLALNPHLRSHINGGNGGNIIAHEENRRVVKPHTSGRWPANLIHDGSDEVVGLFPAQAGAAAPVHRRNSDKFRQSYGAFAGNIDEAGSTFHGDTGSAARFFYCAKASKADRGNGNVHPTVKPTELMRYLCRLVTPPGGVVLDPFIGSGSTGKAALLEGFGFIGIEREAEYLEIARGRIQAPAQGSLFA
jgi:hypothetical protein